MLWAIILGAFLKAFAPASAMFDEKSPFALFAGFSMLNAGNGSAGNSPFATALPSASNIFSFNSI